MSTKFRPARRVVGGGVGAVALFGLGYVATRWLRYGHARNAAVRRHSEERPPQSLIDEVLSIGWGVLAQESGREIVLGAVTQPWKHDVTFRALPPDEFRAFDEPAFAKIVWTIRAEPLGPETSRFYTETRVATTDVGARKRFRRYWTMVSPGVRLIRRESLRLVRADAEHRYRVQLNTEAHVTGSK